MQFATSSRQIAFDFVGKLEVLRGIAACEPNYLADAFLTTFLTILVADLVAFFLEVPFTALTSFLAVFSIALRSFLACALAAFLAALAASLTGSTTLAGFAGLVAFVLGVFGAGAVTAGVSEVFTLIWCAGTPAVT